MKTFNVTKKISTAPHGSVNDSVDGQNRCMAIASFQSAEQSLLETGYSRISCTGFFADGLVVCVYQHPHNKVAVLTFEENEYLS